ncbi:hypothetical protein V5799_027561 [Amblyomma americanum]|uniref:Peptidase M13 N-terminal domain-containing protein n=1 Tax=Amblyomma americanum TaxID=6943 RepID=A0AAQ4DFD1_AMBAM
MRRAVPHLSNVRLQELLASIVREIYQRGGVPTRYDEEILVWNISTFQALDKFLASENRRMLLNYLGWRVVALLGPATTAEMLNARHAFHMAKFGAEDQPQLLSFCFDQAARMLPVAVGRMAFRATGAGDSGQTQRLPLATAGYSAIMVPAS